MSMDFGGVGNQVNNAAKPEAATSGITLRSDAAALTGAEANTRDIFLYQKKGSDTYRLVVDGNNLPVNPSDSKYADEDKYVTENGMVYEKMPATVDKNDTFSPNAVWENIKGIFRDATGMDSGIVFGAEPTRAFPLAYSATDGWRVDEEYLTNQGLDLADYLILSMKDDQGNSVDVMAKNSKFYSVNIQDDKDPATGQVTRSVVTGSEYFLNGPGSKDRGTLTKIKETNLEDMGFAELAMTLGLKQMDAISKTLKSMYKDMEGNQKILEKIANALPLITQAKSGNTDNVSLPTEVVNLYKELGLAIPEFKKGEGKANAELLNGMISDLQQQVGTKTQLSNMMMMNYQNLMGKFQALSDFTSKAIAKMLEITQGILRNM